MVASSPGNPTRMRALLDFSYGPHQIRLEGSDWSGLERVLVDGVIASEHRSFGFSGSHAFTLPDIGLVTLDFELKVRDGEVAFRLHQNQQTLFARQAELPAPNAGVSPRTPADPPESTGEARTRSSSLIAIGGIVFKLFKSAGAVKAVLAGSAFVGWSLLFDWRFSLMLLSIIVFHEYGHVRAMRACNIPTKGFYLIPFLGGVAVGEKARTYWHEVYVSMMGPVYGLVMSAAAWLGYLATEHPVLGLVASFSALINLFNLLPVYPLDGGHVLKAVALSINPKYSRFLLLLVSAAGAAAAAWAGLGLIAFFLVLGAIDLFFSLRAYSAQDAVPMAPYGVVVSLLWYVTTAGLLIGIIFALADTGLPGTEIARAIVEN